MMSNPTPNDDSVSKARQRLTEEERKRAHQPLEHEQEARIRWGRTESWKESARKTSQYTETDWNAIEAERATINDAFVLALTTGIPSGSFHAMSIADMHRKHINDWYYSCDYDQHTRLADMYLADARFTAHYEDQHAGLAQYVHDAIWANAMLHLNGDLTEGAQYVTPVQEDSTENVTSEELLQYLDIQYHEK